MADEIKFGISLEDHVSEKAHAAATALRQMSGALGDAKAKLAFYQQQLSHANEIGDVAGHRHFGGMVDQSRKELYALSNQLGSQAGLDSAARAWDKYGAAARRAGDGIFRVVEPAEVARHAIDSLGRGVHEMASALSSGDAGGAIRGAAEALGGMAQAIDLVIPGLGQVASGAIRAGGAIGGMFAEIIEKGVELSLEVSATNNRMRATFDALGVQGPASGQRTLDMLNKLSSTLPQSREKLAEYEKDFEALGFTDMSQLRYQVQATASAQAIMGDTGAEAYEHLSKKIRLAVEAHAGLKLGERPLEQIYKMGSNATDVANRLGISVQTMRRQLEAGTMDAQKFGNALSESLIAKGKGPLDAMMNSLGTIKEKDFEAFRHLFDGVDVTPLTDAFRMILQIGDAGEPAGAGLKGGITKGMNGIVKALGEMTIRATAFFLHLEASAIRLQTKVQPIVNAFDRISSVISKIDKFAGNTFASSVPPELRPVVGAAFDTIRGYSAHPGATEEWKKKFGPAGELPPQLEPIVPPMLARPPESASAPSVSGPTISEIHKVVDTAIAAHGGAHKITNVNGLVVNITAPEGVTDAQSMSVTGIGSALERIALMGAR